jgi:exodeoxyribonuclease-3
MKISTWNVNSVRARIKNITNYIKLYKPDILMIQEIKTEEKNFPFIEFKELGYSCNVFGQKAYNGVAIISKINVDKVNLKFFKDPYNQSRIIECDIKSKSKIIKLINIYVHNGNPIDTDKYKYKIKWYDNFILNVKKKLLENENIIIGGDFNVIPEEIDVFDFKKFKNDALFKLEVRKKFRELINLGFQDAYRYFFKNKQEYTFWDYMAGSWQKNNGMRIDHFLISNNLIENIKNIEINKKPRSKTKPSDHTPIEIEII